MSPSQFNLVLVDPITKKTKIPDFILRLAGCKSDTLNQN